LKHFIISPTFVASLGLDTAGLVNVPVWLRTSESRWKIAADLTLSQGKTSRRSMMTQSENIKDLLPIIN